MSIFTPPPAPEPGAPDLDETADHRSYDGNIVVRLTPAGRAALRPARTEPVTRHIDVGNGLWRVLVRIDNRTTECYTIDAEAVPNTVQPGQSSLRFTIDSRTVAIFERMAVISCVRLPEAPE